MILRRLVGTQSKFLAKVTSTHRKALTTSTNPFLTKNQAVAAPSTQFDKMAKHQAIVCKSKEGWQKLTLEQIPTPVPGDGEVLIKIAAAGVNYPDVLICEEKYQMKPAYPFSPGGELAGTVVAVGPKVSTLKVGDRVATMTGFGAFQEKIVVNEGSCLKVPDYIPLDIAAGLFFTYGTSLHALKDRGALKAGETVLILGASGGVGTAAIELAKAMGATVIAAASSPEKLDVCKKFGADMVINYSTENIKTKVAELTKGKGVDVVYDAVGGNYAEPAVRSLAWRGRYLVIGFVAGIPKIPLNLLLLKGASMNGVFWGMFTAREPENYHDDVNLIMKWVAEKKLNPGVTGRFALKDAPKAIGLMADRKVVGKVIVLCDGSAAKL